jgi:hypothetical protein
MSCRKLEAAFALIAELGSLAGEVMIVYRYRWPAAEQP